MDSTNVDNGGATFAGQQWANDDVPEFLLIFDANGYIAGMQSVVPVSVTSNDAYYNFSASPMYKLRKK